MSVATTRGYSFRLAVTGCHPKPPDYSASNALTLMVEAELTPFEAVPTSRGGAGYLRAREMNLHSLPWPIEELEGLGALEVEMKVTLSYFIEPNPSARGWTKRYLYESHGLRFDIKRPFEDDEDFVERINLKARAEEDASKLCVQRRRLAHWANESKSRVLAQRSLARTG